MAAAIRAASRFATLREQVSVLLACMLSFTWPHAALAALDGVVAHFPSTSSGMIARSRGDRELYWLDNDRVVFIGSKAGETRIEKGQQFPRNDLFVWNIAKDDIRRVAELTSTSEICLASDKYVRYHFEKDGVQIVRFGEFSRTHEAELDVQAIKDEILSVSPISCREYNPKLLRKRYGNWALPLLNRGEYLDRSSGDTSEPMRYFPSDGSAQISLATIPKRKVRSIPRYSEYLKKYVFQEVRSRTGPDTSYRLWLLDHRGKVTEAILPAGPWMAGSVGASPAHGNRWVMFSHALDTAKGGIGAAGIYLIDGARADRIAKGYPHAFAVSPDGCKVVTAIETEPRQEKSQPVVWMFDMCAKRGK